MKQKSLKGDSTPTLQMSTSEMRPNQLQVGKRLPAPGDQAQHTLGGTAPRGVSLGFIVSLTFVTVTRSSHSKSVGPAASPIPSPLPHSPSAKILPETRGQSTNKPHRVEGE